ncbi:DUF1302 domain-containing protein [Nitrospiraceae bacterium AH_259_D15_M11_P09]|nr:DUF1302 domain-containing protein [Nitrospiraceae bacterium AH_259_D15_M11_P09]
MCTVHTLHSSCSIKLRLLSKLILATVFAFGQIAADSRPALAVELEFLDGQVTGYFDTTVSLGVSVRVADRDDSLIGIANGGTATTVNTDDGNLNYKQGDITSAATKAIHELELKWRNFEFFGRGFYFYDWLVADTERTKLTEQAEGRTVRDIELLDAYGVSNFEVRNSPVTVRLGNQVINWGESTFIQNGINTINPVDVSKLRVAGAELREALTPVPALDVDIAFTDKLSVEAFYQFGWRRTDIDPKGTFFSTNDFISPGGNFAVVKGAGTSPDNPPTFDNFVTRAGDRNPRDFGEFGVALRYFEPALYDTEFGLYYIHYHSRLPLTSASSTTGGIGSASGAGYFVEYPDDIDLLGASFNSEIDIGTNSLAIQGELSYRFDQPLQVDDSELIVAALNLCGVGGRQSQLDANGAGALCGFAAGEKINGFRTKEVLQAQMTVTQILGATFGADQVVLLGEAGLTWVPDLEATSVLRYDGPGTGPGDPGTAAANGVPLQTDGFADKFSWGYRLLGQLLFNDAIAAVNLAPQVAFAHDLEGTTPSPIGNFVKDRKTVTLSLRATYLERWQARVAYTNFFGAGSFNLVNDRDFVSTVVSYAF